MKLLKEKDFIPVPSCFDALSAKLIEQANFDVTFIPLKVKRVFILGLLQTSIVARTIFKKLTIILLRKNQGRAQLILILLVAL